MCIGQRPSDDTDGEMCIQNQKFLAVSNIEGYFDVTGMVGLGPQREFDDESVVWTLARDNLIDSAKVGLNFEDPMSPDLRTSLRGL